MIELHAHPDRCRALVERGVDRIDRRLLAQRDQPWRAEHLGVARPHGPRGVFLTHEQTGTAPHPGLERHGAAR
jgi:hypothetical protein